MVNRSRTFRWDLPNRLTNLRRTAWQIRSLATCGRTGLALAEEVIATGRCIRRKWELLAMMVRVKRLRPAVVVEIGTYRGGSLRCWASVCPAHTRFVCIDLPWEESAPEEMGALHHFLKPGQSQRWLRKDSHAPATKEVMNGPCASWGCRSDSTTVMRPTSSA